MAKNANVDSLLREVSGNHFLSGEQYDTEGVVVVGRVVVAVSVWLGGCNVPAGADIREEALIAEGFAGGANLAAVEDHAVAEEGPLIGGDEGHEVAFDLDGVVVDGEAEALAEAANVGVDGDAGGVEGVAEDDVGGLAAHSGEGDEFVHGARDLAGVAFDELLATGLYVAGLVAEEAGGLDEALEFGEVGVGVVLGGEIAGEEGGRDEVDADIGALRGKDGGDEKLERVLVIEGAVGVGVELGEAAEDGTDALGGFVGRGDLGGGHQGTFQR